MTLSDFAILSQIAGTVIVAITLIVLTLEVRQGAEQLRSGSRQTQLENDQTGLSRSDFLHSRHRAWPRAMGTLPRIFPPGVRC